MPKSASAESSKDALERSKPKSQARRRDSGGSGRQLEEAPQLGEIKEPK